MQMTKCHRSRLFIAAMAAFATYSCMYAFRKPFTAATFQGQEVWGLGLKTVLVVSQLAGYMLSKFIGIKVISEMRGDRRAVAIVALILTAEVALVGFAFVPVPLKFVMMFLNGLPLGMVFGLVMGYLEGRRQTEALSAMLCVSFIVASGVVKSVGRWLIVDMGISEYLMPMLTGLIFFLPLLVAVWILQTIPPPDDVDRVARSPRKVMDRAERRRFWQVYWPGLSMLLIVFVALTIIRTLRDDFGVEIWRDLGVTEAPSVFARSETLVAIFVTALSATAMWIKHNLTALRVTVGLMFAAFVLIGGATVLHQDGLWSPFHFMVACGVGLYIPYVAFHTTVFERFIATTNHPCNFGFLMYLADSLGYLGYAIVIVLRKTLLASTSELQFFQSALYGAAALSVLALLGALVYFEKVLSGAPTAKVDAIPALRLEELAPAD